MGCDGVRRDEMKWGRVKWGGVGVTLAPTGRNTAITQILHLCPIACVTSFSGGIW